jgi:DNA-binding FadR family transcriptional regulator
MIDRTSYEPLYHQIQKDIEAQILDGRIKIGDKLMSEAEMLNHYKVGRVTIRNALSALVAAGCLRKEQGLGTFCVAKPGRERKSIDVFLTTTDTYFTPYFLSGIGRELNKRDSDLILHDTLDDMAVTAQLLNETLDRGTD